MISYNDFFNSVSGEDFEERPVDIETFVVDYLHHPPLSENQVKIIKASTQIYRRETLHVLYGDPDKAEERWKETYNEIICALGKGSGKDAMARISCAYVVYLLLCLRDPQKYYGKPSGDSIDVMNIAINADQANRVFFRGFVQLIKGCEWFDGRFDPKRTEVNFDKNINLVSGHSEAESLEGYNVIFVVLDEISGFEDEKSGTSKTKTADAIYNMHRFSVDSRFPDFGKLILLSFPRRKNDFITQRYDDVVAEKETIVRTVTLKRDPDMPDGTEGNEFNVSWDEDHILRYKYPRMWAMRRPTWEINPTKKIEDFTRAFDANMVEALGRFAAQPTAGGDDAVFKNHEALDETFVAVNAVDKDGIFLKSFEPDPKKEYYIHVDLAQKHDRCAVTMSHVEKFVTIEMGGSKMREVHPTVKIDAIRWWQPSTTESVDFKWVTDYILALSRRGFNIKLVTFDRWNSNDVRNFLESRGMMTDNLSVGNDQYLDLMSIMYDQRLLGPNVPELLTELKGLRWIKGKVDHTSSGFKDLSDTVAGSVYNAVRHTKRPRNNVVEVHTLRDIYAKEREAKWKGQAENVIEPPKGDPTTMPESLKQFMGRIL